MQEADLIFIFRTDIHMADRSPRSWKGDYVKESFGCLNQIGALAKKTNATAVLDGGDFIHVKKPSKTSHALMEAVVREHRDYPCPVFCLEGNHDMTGNALSSIPNQPLGVLYASGTFIQLRDQTFYSDGVKVRVAALPYCHDRKLEDIQSIQKRDEDYLIAVVHALATDDASTAAEGFFGETVFHYGDLVSPNGPDVFCFGHWHRDQGVVQKNGVWFVNQGAVSRGSLSKDNLDRVPKVTKISCDRSGVSCEAIELSVLPAEQVFDLEKKRREDMEDENIRLFVERLCASGAEDADDIDGMLSRLSQSASTYALVKEYMERARLR
jgi:DNA repair exonuclease SbcCD nuclease subunit